MRSDPLCTSSRLWGTVCCLLSESATLALELLSFGAGGAYEIIWGRGLEAVPSPEELRAAFVAAYPGRVLLISDWIGVISALSWLTAMCLLMWMAWTWARSWLWRQPEVLFFPDESGTHVQRICKLLASSRKRVWLAMFAFSDHALADALLRAHRRGVDVRVILDEEQCHSPGAEGDRLAAGGICVLRESSTARMHHKFAIIDHAVLSGSFNWTRQASVANCENICLLRESHIVRCFVNEFCGLWQNFDRKSGQVAQKVAFKRRRDGTPPKFRLRATCDKENYCQV
eukprot:TRINITY_DN24426_c0_g1_i1.p1 TRINITY_DN24426_c0_g1~~TRINITY_DN24426_c0_g1_i1.p1  ORF type:complete len:286 (+),score=42.91 TRINITY_DN24426_c0_g1_i1:102-959(+)